MTSDLCIAVDAMGGDHAPQAMVDGALAAARRAGLHVRLVGRSADVEAALARHDADVRRLVTVVDAPDVVQMAEAPLAA
ncbi:MAG TPA: hypothetical protein VMM93_08360, partial [Vicinamibacterales bacterium]|nr:hypothetical protein [Vicinamibacterales bacterium]